MSERGPQIQQDEIDLIFKGMVSDGLRVTSERGTYSSSVVDSHSLVDGQPTLEEVYYHLVDQRYSVEEIEAMHQLKIDESGEVRELGENDIEEKEEVVYEV